MNSTQVKNALSAAKKLKAVRESFEYARRENANIYNRMRNGLPIHGSVSARNQLRFSRQTLARLHRIMVNRAENFSQRYPQFSNQNINNTIRNLAARTIQRHARGAAGRRSAARYAALGGVRINTTSRSPSGSVRRGLNGLNEGVIRRIMNMARRR